MFISMHGFALGDDVCAITTPPCGNTDSEPPKVTFT